MVSKKETGLTKRPAATKPRPRKDTPPPPPPDEEASGRKHSKKHPKKHGPKEKESGKHLRRAFEHLGRVEVLQSIAAARSPETSSLLELARSAISHGNSRDAADLLRIAEHLGFAAAATASKSPSSLSPDLEEAIRREFRKLLEHAEHHDLPKSTQLGKLLRATLDRARSAFDRSSFREALELARAAEGLASLDADDAEALDLPAPRG